MTATPSFSAARSAGDSLPASTNQRLRLEIFEVKLELVLAISGIERRRGRRGGHAEKRRRHFGSVRQHNGDPIAAPNSEFVERALRAIDKHTQTRVAQRRGAVRSDGGRLVTPRCDEASQGTIRAHGPQLRMRSCRASDSPLPLRATVWPKSFVTA